MTTQLNYFKEKLILQEEEKQLKKMLEKFQDQQNRLKIEELALISMMKMEQEKIERGESVTRSATSSRQAGSESSRTYSSITSKEMSNFAPVGIMTEDASVINKQMVDLDLEHTGLYRNVSNDNGEEEEEEEMDSEEEEKQADAEALAESHQLMSFMEDF